MVGTHQDTQSRSPLEAMTSLQRKLYESATDRRVDEHVAVLQTLMSCRTPEDLYG